MGLFGIGSSKDSNSALAVPDDGIVPPSKLWGDKFGMLATRGLQIIVVVALAAGIIWGLRQITLVVIPVLYFAAMQHRVAELQSEGRPS